MALVPWYLVLWNSEGHPNHDARFPWVVVGCLYSLQDAQKIVGSDGDVRIRELMRPIPLAQGNGEPVRLSEERLNGRWVG